MRACLGTTTTVVFTSRGMNVNDSVGKTEVLFRFDGIGAAAARDGVNTGTFKVTADNSNFGRFDIWITEHYEHLGVVDTGPHKYDLEVESRVNHAQATNNAFRNNIFGNKGLPQKDRLIAWKAFVFPKRVFHLATWGTPTVEIWKTLHATYHQGLRISHGETK